MYQKLAAKIAGQPEERILSLLMLRSLKQARYSEKNEGHFALASDAYTHFTSPIRRYPDLIVHRILTALLARHGPIVVTEKPGRTKSASARKNPAPTKSTPRKNPPPTKLPPRTPPCAETKKPPPTPAATNHAKRNHTRKNHAQRNHTRKNLHPTTPPFRREKRRLSLRPQSTPASQEHAAEKSASSFQPPPAPPKKHAPLSIADLAAIAQSSSEAERHADDAERELIEWKKMRFMEDRIGDEFDALVISATKHGLFIELEDLFIEGLIPLPALSDLGERFLYREATRQLIGEDSGRRFAIGDRVRVLLDRIQRTERRLLFALIDQDALPQPLKHSRHPKSKRRRR